MKIQPYKSLFHLKMQEFTIHQLISYNYTLGLIFQYYKGWAYFRIFTVIDNGGSYIKQ